MRVEALSLVNHNFWEAQVQAVLECYASLPFMGRNTLKADRVIPCIRKTGMYAGRTSKLDMINECCKIDRLRAYR